MIDRSDLDPRSPEIVALLQGLDPETELVARLALCGICPKCRQDSAWRKRMDELLARVPLNKIELADILRKAGEMEMKLREDLAQQLAGTGSG
jgi:hypothetical protein